MHEKEVVTLAIESLRKTETLDLLWKTFRKDDPRVIRFLKRNDATIYKTAEQLRNKDNNKRETYPYYDSDRAFMGECIEQISVPQIENIQWLAGSFPEILYRLRYPTKDDEINRPELSSEAITKSEKLLTDVIKRYDWEEKGNFYVNYQLGLLLSRKSKILSVTYKNMPKP